ncbi:MAG: hypothetical protein ACLFR0_08955, partial [Alphaproteobacteria bacterium]
AEGSKDNSPRFLRSLPSVAMTGKVGTQARYAFISLRRAGTLRFFRSGVQARYAFISLRRAGTLRGHISG